MLDVLTPRTPPELATGVLDVIGRTSSGAAGKAVVERWAKFTPGGRTAAVALLMRRPEWTTALLDGLESGAVQVSDLGIDIEQRLSRHANAALAGRAKTILARGGRTITADRQKVLDELLPLAEKRGEAAAGKLVFEQHCGKCHRHNGVGGQVGPDLTGVAARKRGEILTEVIDPNRSVEGNFQQYTAITSDGEVLSGLLAAETRTAIEIIDAEAKRHVVLRENIEELKGSKLSVMPEGFEKLTPAEIINLLEFLTTRGKYFPLPLGKAATVVTTKNVFFNSDSSIERLAFSDWSPKTAFGVPFTLIDPLNDRLPNAVMLHGPQGDLPPNMPRTVTLPCNGPARAIHFLSGISGWGYPASAKGSVSMIVRLHYADGKQEDHKLINGEHFADYIRRVDVPKSKFAFALGGRQLRYFAVQPARSEPIADVELVKGDDATAPIVMAVTVESP
jgi:putative heme-binding domain-containing protein